ncbi:MAG: HemK2/MTQ2 family protein methyltransferase [Thermoleophilaceae bacterium]
MQILVPPGVYKPDTDTRMLARLVESEPRLSGSRVLDVCTGSGAVALTAARGGAREVEAVDVSRKAVATTRLNAALNRVKVHAHHGDLFGPFDGREFDLVVSNPPYIPGDDELPTRGPSRAWEGGERGRRLIDRVVAGAPAHLRPGGSLMVVQSSICGTEETLQAMRHVGLQAELVESETGPLGPLFTERVVQLERAGLLKPGHRHEELVVLRGRAGG